MTAATEVRERPILFSGPMVRAILDGRKTQTRRVVKLPHQNPLGCWEATVLGGEDAGRTAAGEVIPSQGVIWHTRTGDCIACPYGQPSERIWVREAWQAWSEYDGTSPTSLPDEMLRRVNYLADGLVWDSRRRASNHMPRPASRLTLEIIDVRVQRLQSISAADCFAEGVRAIPWDQCAAFVPGTDIEATGGSADARYRECFRRLWDSDSLNAAHADGWDASPWVWAITFRRVEAR
jgi:hypothetical protein